PSEAERPVAGTGVVRDVERRAEAVWRRAQWHLHRRGAGDRVGAELFADAADRAPAFRQRNRREQAAVPARAGAGRLAWLLGLHGTSENGSGGAWQMGA